jgi:O-antigen/teichoic acid export membrane protein
MPPRRAMAPSGVSGPPSSARLICVEGPSKQAEARRASAGSRRRRRPPVWCAGLEHLRAGRAVTQERTAEETDIGTQGVSGVLWSTAQKWAIRASGFVTLIVLTRRISPQDFGVMAAAMTLIPMIYLLADLGFSTYLLQTEDIDQTSLSTAFWTSVAAGGVLSIALLAVARPLAAAFRTPQLAEVLAVTVLAVVPTVLAAVPLALLRRALAFRLVALQAFVAAFSAQVVAVIGALLGAGVWALVAQLVVAQWIVAVLAWRAARWLPSLRASPTQFRQMVAFGVRVSSVDLIASSRLWLESWIVSLTLGTASLGLLNVGQRIVQVAQDLTAASLTPVSTVVFAKVRGSSERLRGTYLKALGVAYGVVSPAMVLVVVTAPVLIPLLVGEAWQASVVPTQALAVAGIVTLGAMLDHGLFYGLGRPGTWLAYAVVVDALTVGTTAVAVHWGLPGVAVGFVGVAVSATIARWVLVGRLLGLPLASMARPFVSVMIAAAASIVAGSLTLDAVLGTRPVVALVVSASVTLAVDLVLLRVVAGDILRDALSLLPVPERHARRVRRWLRFEAPVPT